MKTGLRRFHKDEEGLEAVQVVMIVAIAAVILALLKWQWPTVRDWFKDEVANVIGWKRDG